MSVQSRISTESMSTSRLEERAPGERQLDATRPPARDRGPAVMPSTRTSSSTSRPRPRLRPSRPMCTGRSIQRDASISARRAQHRAEVDGDDRHEQHGDRHGRDQPHPAHVRQRGSEGAQHLGPHRLLHDGQHRSRVHRLPLGHRAPTRPGRPWRRAARSPSSWLRPRRGPAAPRPRRPAATSTRTTLPGIGADEPLRAARRAPPAAARRGAAARRLDGHVQPAAVARAHRAHAGAVPATTTAGTLRLGAAAGRRRRRAATASRRRRGRRARRRRRRRP